MQVWGICKGRFAAAAFSGEGARLYSGRWNPAGVSMVYTSQSLALAAMEFFIHLDPMTAPEDLVSTAATLPEDVAVEHIEITDLPPEWRTTENAMLQKMGAEWVASERSVALKVPSVAIGGEWNVLLNPKHPDFSSIAIEAARPFHFDQRMFRPDPRLRPSSRIRTGRR